MAPLLLVFITSLLACAASTRYEHEIRKALRGDLRSAFVVGLMLLDGSDGAPQDTAAAAQWFRRCANSGDPQAQTRLGYMYSEGIGVQSDPVEALRWFRSAALAGYPPAEFDLGMVYLDGRGLHPDIDAAVRWLTRAAEHRYSEAQMNLALLYFEGRPGLPRDTASGWKWMQAAANAHNVCAEYNLGVLYRTARIPDEQQAARWFGRAARHLVARGDAMDISQRCGTGPPPPAD